MLLVWVKLSSICEPTMGLGYWTRNNVELLVMSTRGKFFKYRNSKNVSQYFHTLHDQSDTLEHSSKPNKTYDILN